RCLSATYVEQGMGVVALTNADDGEWVIVEAVRAIAKEYAWPDYLPKHVTVMVDAQVYADYVGEYEVRPGFSFKLSTGENRLFLEATNQIPLALQPSSQSTFFAQTVNCEIAFTKDEGGDIIGLILKQEQQEIPAQKVW